MVLAFIITVILAIVLGVGWYLQSELFFYKNIISFKDSYDLLNLPVITMYAGKKKLHFLLDTGSSNCILNAKELENMIYEKGETNVPMMGVTGEIRNCGTLATTTLSYSGLKFDIEFIVTDMTEAFQNIKKESGVQLHGILGTDFFTRYKYILDFDKLLFYKK